MDIDVVVLIVASACFVGLIFFWHVTKEVAFDLKNILINNDSGKFSLYKLGQLVALCVSTWVLIHETRTGRLSEWLFVLVNYWV